MVTFDGNYEADTEFNDALRAHGIIPQKPEEPEEPEYDIPSTTDLLHALASTANADQLGVLANEANDSDDERMFETYRRQRIAEMGVDRKKARFGSLEPLARDEFVREVTEGSKVSYDENGDVVQEEVKVKKSGYDEDDEDDEEEKPTGLKGTGVVVFLYKDSVPLCQHLRPLLQRLAALHPATKFLSIIGDQCIPNYPDRNLPTLLIYRNGEMVRQLVAGMGLKGMKTTLKDQVFTRAHAWHVEYLLMACDALEKFSAPAESSRARDESDEESDDSHAGGTKAKRGGLRSAGKQVVEADDDDSDFDL